MQVEWFGDKAIKVTFEEPTAAVRNRLVYRSDEASLEPAGAGRAWSFQGDGYLFRLIRRILSVISRKVINDRGPIFRFEGSHAVSVLCAILLAHPSYFRRHCLSTSGTFGLDPQPVRIAQQVKQLLRLR